MCQGGCVVLGYPAAPLQHAPSKQLMHSSSAVPQGSQQVCAVLGTAASLGAAKDAIRGCSWREP